jgi:elongation factor 1-beta
MGIAAVKIKIMPISPDINLEEIKEKAKKSIEQKGGKNCNFEEELIAFGLKAVIAFFAWPEEKELENLEEELKKIKNVNSAQLIDIRRAIG